MILSTGLFWLGIALISLLIALLVIWIKNRIGSRRAESHSDRPKSESEEPASCSVYNSYKDTVAIDDPDVKDW